MLKNYDGNPQSPPAPRGQQNGGMPANAGLGDLANLVAQVDAQGAAVDEPPPLPPVKGDPEPPADPTEQGDDGQTTTPPDETTQTPGGEAGEDSSALSQTDNNADLTEALKDLNDDAKAHLAEMARAIANGDTSIGQLKRGHKVAEDFRAKIEELETKIAELSEGASARPQAANAATGNSSNLPPEVAKLKTLEEVEGHTEKAKAAVRFLEDFLDDNPNGGQIGDKSYTRQEIKAKKREWEDDLAALPKQANALVRQQQEIVQRHSARADLERDYPWIKQSDHEETKAVRETLKANPWLKGFVSPEYAAAIWSRGTKAMQAELAARQGKKPLPAGVKPAGKVAPGKPHATSAAVPAKGGADASVRSALNGVMEKGDRTSLAQFLTATGR